MLGSEVTVKYVSAFSSLVKAGRKSRNWSVAELARRASLTQPEVSRVESGNRKPTLRHVRGIAVAFAGAPSKKEWSPQTYAEWLVILVDLGERARIEAWQQARLNR